MLLSLIIPVAPIEEQERIVKEIEHSFTLINSLEKDKTDLQTAIKQAKSKILDLAIHGKLVPQDSSDEPVSVLLEKIRAEKEAKIKAVNSRKIRSLTNKRNNKIKDYLHKASKHIVNYCLKENIDNIIIGTEPDIVMDPGDSL